MKKTSLKILTSPAGLKVLSLFLCKEYKLFMVSPAAMEGSPLGPTRYTDSTTVGVLPKQSHGGSDASAAMADAIPTPIFPSCPPEGFCHKETAPAQVN